MEHETGIEIWASSTQLEAVCPTCDAVSRNVHSYYQRAPADLPVLDKSLRLRLTVKHFRCRNEDCSRATFVEQMPEMVVRYAKRTNRLNTALEVVAFALGGQAGSRLASKLKIPAGRNTLLRLVRRSPARPVEEPEVIGVDDWAKRRGQVYGTILVDLERRRVVDLLSDRTAETLAAWLQAHPGVKTVARDRSSEYACGITTGAPQAEQVADRWHLLVNLREAFERLLDRLRPELKTHLPPKDPQKGAYTPVLRRRHRSREQEAAKDERRVRRRTVHDEVHRCYTDSQAIRAIARDMKLSRTTVYKTVFVRFSARYCSQTASQHPGSVRGLPAGALESWL